jgi:Tfp pilus assembly protein PilO
MTTPLTRIANQIGSRRWEAGLSIFVLLLLWLVIILVAPFAASQVRRVADLSALRSSIKKSGELDRELATTKAQTHELDSLLHAVTERKPLRETDLVGQVYALADSAGCRTGKVEILPAIVTGKGKETPVLFRGAGTYAAMGKFVDGIENMGYVTRVRQLTMSKTSGDVGSLTLDFVVIDGEQ